MTAERIYCAVDTTDLDAALALAELPNDEVGGLKPGVHMMTIHASGGAAMMRAGDPVSAARRIAEELA